MPDLRPPQPAAAAPTAAPPVKIVAKPLSSPDFLDLKPKNPAISIRWVNRGHENGHRVDVHSAQGFEIAKPEDIEKLPPSLVKDGQIIYGDLILMKLPKADYYGALLNNHNKAVRRLQRGGIQQRGEAMMEEELNLVPGKRTDKRKIVVYSPSNPNEIQEAIREGRL